MPWQTFHKFLNASVFVESAKVPKVFSEDFTLKIMHTYYCYSLNLTGSTSAWWGVRGEALCSGEGWKIQGAWAQV